MSIAIPDPNTGNTHLDRCLMWYRLMSNVVLPVEQRSMDIQIALKGFTLDMGVVTEGKVEAAELSPGGDTKPVHFCVSAGCALGSASVYPWFNLHGLMPDFRYQEMLKTWSMSGNTVVVDGEVDLYHSPRVAKFWGLEHDDLVHITATYSYNREERDEDEMYGFMIKDEAVLEHMRFVFTKTFGEAFSLHPWINGTPVE